MQDRIIKYLGLSLIIIGIFLEFVDELTENEWVMNIRSYGDYILVFGGVFYFYGKSSEPSPNQ